MFQGGTTKNVLLKLSDVLNLDTHPSMTAAYRFKFTGVFVDNGLQYVYTATVTATNGVTEWSNEKYHVTLTPET